MLRRDEVATSGALVEAPASVDRAEAFRRLADRHLDDSYRLARAILGNAAEAEDATHDAFVAAWRSWGSLRDPARFEHWFDRILVNTCRNRLRRAARHPVRDISEQLVAGPDAALAQAHDRDVVATALARLDPEHRIVVALRFYRDLSVDEIAQRIGVRSGTVKSRLHYALRRMHDALDEADAKEALR